jgi:hypothetical protein
MNLIRFKCGESIVKARIMPNHDLSPQNHFVLIPNTISGQYRRHPRTVNERMRLSLLLSILLACLAIAQDIPENLKKYDISATGINASFIGYGARLTNLYVNDKNGMPQDVVLGYDDGASLHS